MDHEVSPHMWNDIYHVLKKMQNEATTCIQAMRPSLGGTTFGEAAFSISVWAEGC